MCLILLAINQHPSFPIMLLSNRDEYYERKSLPAHNWTDFPQIYGGIDLLESGTWLSVHRDGRFAFVTNYRDLRIRKKEMKSRGLLVKNFLTAENIISPFDYLNQVRETADYYNGFNLVVGKGTEIYYFSNQDPTKSIKRLTRGVYGISNHLLDTPWFKVTLAKNLFIARKEQLLRCQTDKEIEETLYPILLNDTLAPIESELPNTGYDSTIERLLSSIFVRIVTQHYGTCCASCVLFDNNGAIRFSEKIYNEHGFLSESTAHLNSDLLAPKQLTTKL